MVDSILGMTPDWRKHWRGMPEFAQKDLQAFQSISVNFRTPEDRDDFARLIGQNLTDTTSSLWYPRQPWSMVKDKPFTTTSPVSPKYPIYIVSKGRHESRYTVRALEQMGVPYKVIVEEQQFDDYASVIDPGDLLVLPKKYQADYETCDDLGSKKSKGPGAARNFAWEHSIKSGASWHWVMDDNIKGFYRLFCNNKIPVTSGVVFRVMESFCERYSNVAIAGPNYFMFASRKGVMPPFVLNTRIYSCLLIRNDIPYRWRGRYNEDTDLCLRVLEDGLVTVQFNAMLQRKEPTQTVKGGCMEEFYAHEGTGPKSAMLEKMHPDVAKVTWRFGRWHHHVDYSRFRSKLIPKQGVRPETLPETDNFGMHREANSYLPLLIGQAPSKSGHPSAPLEGKIAERIADLAGISIKEYLSKTERVNLLREFPGKNGKGDAFPMDAARAAAADMAAKLKSRRVVFLGKNVAATFEESLPILTWRRSKKLKCEVAILPHPSGISTWWNDPENRKAAAKFLKQLFEDTV